MFYEIVYLFESVSLRRKFSKYRVQLSEQQYWQLISKGDKKAYEDVFRSYYSSLVHYACSLLKDMDEAEEVAQNVFYNIWYKRESLQITTSIKSYLYRAVHNDCLNKIQHGKVRNLYAEEIKNTMPRGSEDASKQLEGKELNTIIQQALEELPEQCGIVFRLNRFEHLKYTEIADQLGISVKTVEGHMGKALKLLRVSLKDYLPLLTFLLFVN